MTRRSDCSPRRRAAAWAVALLALASNSGASDAAQRRPGPTGQVPLHLPQARPSVQQLPSATLFAALRQVESGGRADAVGDGGRARGPYQIHRGYWADGCRALGVTWSYDALVTSDAHCRAVMAAYWRRYGASTDEQRARMHNGGPRHGRASTDGYWRRVRQHLTVR